ncbi:hypothetical protein [Streptomyces kasugaensis]|nr:hypothetical protein [Streptomyces kasugaensis]
MSKADEGDMPANVAVRSKRGQSPSRLVDHCCAHMERALRAPAAGLPARGRHPDGMARSVVFSGSRQERVFSSQGIVHGCGVAIRATAGVLVLAAATAVIFIDADRSGGGTAAFLGAAASRRSL